MLSALILNYRSPLQTLRCVEALKNQTIASDMEILVIDNHSDTDSIGILRTRLKNDPRVQIIETPKNKGFGSGYNKGATYARGDYLLFNNPDKILPPNGCEKLIQSLKNDNTIGIIAPKLMHPDGSTRESPRRFPRPLDVIIKRLELLHSPFQKQLDRYLVRELNAHVAQSVDWIAGGCFAMKRSTFEKLDGFDERFFLFFEDTDLCRRCKTNGLKVIYDPTIIGQDRKNRLSEGGLWHMLTSKIGRIHLISAWKYFWKYGFSPTPTFPH